MVAQILDDHSPRAVSIAGLQWMTGGVSVPTIHRAIKYLRTRGVPVEFERSPSNRGWVALKTGVDANFITVGELVKRRLLDPFELPILMLAIRTNIPPQQETAVANPNGPLRVVAFWGNEVTGVQPVDYWINFVLYAVVGRLREADTLLAEFGDEIRLAAKQAARDFAVPDDAPLFRGVLLEPDQVKSGRVKRDGRPFASFSEDRDVACWFSDPDAIISQFVLQQRPGVAGYVTEAKARGKREMLWHYSWADKGIPLAMAAQAHPDIPEGQFNWNVETQAEVILTAPEKGTFTVVEREGVDCPSTVDLDDRFTFPPFLAESRRPRNDSELLAALFEGT